MEDYLDMNDPISIKFQGIEMRGINDSRTSIRSHQALEEHEVDTKFGMPVRVYIQQGKKPTALITFHDVGTNYISFLSFFNCPEMRVILDHFTVYHVCAPGHQHSSRSVNNELSHEESYRLLSSRTGSSDQSSEIFTVSGDQKKQTTIRAYPLMDELAEMVDDVADHFEIKYFLGFGMGAGANVLARYGLKHPEKLYGLFLLNPDDTTTSYYHWGRASWSDIPYMKTGIVTEWIQSWLLDHWFGACTERNIDVEQSYLQLLDELNPISVAGYVESYMNRTALGITRPLHSLDTIALTIKVESFLVTGEMATDLARAMVEMNGNMDPTKTQFISVPDTTGAVMDEAPSKLAGLLLNYLRNLGMLITVTPEKLQKAALQRQIDQAKAMHETETCEISYECTDKC